MLIGKCEDFLYDFKGGGFAAAGPLRSLASLASSRDRSRVGEVRVARELLALAILAMTVGLIRSESAGSLRTLIASGSTSRIRRPRPRTSGSTSSSPAGAPCAWPVTIAPTPSYAASWPRHC